MSTQWLNRCCNPLKKDKHTCERKNLRTVSKQIVEKFPEVAGQKICDRCRKEVYDALKSIPDKLSELQMLQGSDSKKVSEHQNLEEQSSSSLQCGADEFIDQKGAVDCLNESLQFLGETPVKRKKLKLKSYPQEKSKKIAYAVQKLFEIDSTKEDAVVSAESEIIDQLREKFNSSSSRSEKVQILTILPKSWSIRKIEKVFPNATNFMLRKAKELVKEKGILSEPNPKPGKSLPENIIKIVTEFYESDMISRVMPGKKDCVSVKQLDETRICKQKRLILSNLKEVHASFKKTYPDKNIGFSKFAELRPKHCILAGAHGTHSVCVCTIHQNFKLMMIGGKIADLTSTEEVPLKIYKDCIAVVICNPPQPACYFGDCKECAKADRVSILKEKLRYLLDENMVDTITYKHWVSVDRSTLETVTNSSDDFLDLFFEKLKILLYHSFIAKQQSMFQADIKLQLQPGEFLAIFDFAENYSFVLQDEAQGYHWNNSQSTVHPCVIYFIDNEEKLQHVSFVIISECLIHDTIATHLFQRFLIDFLKDKYSLVKKVIYFSDGAAAHYKNRKNFINLCYHKKDFAVCAEWHFTATAHGKGVCDGVGGTLKRLAARASLQRPYDQQIMTPKHLFEWAVRNISSISFKYSTIDDYWMEEKKLKDRYEQSRTIPGTQKLHSFIPLTTNTLCTKIYSNSLVSKVEQITKVEGELPFTDIKGFVTAVYDGKWWLACVINSDEDNAQIKLSFLHPSGPSPSFSFPGKPDELYVPIQTILTLVDPTTATGRVYTLTKKETMVTTEKLYSYRP